jgi:hypothetical protein
VPIDPTRKAGTAPTSIANWVAPDANSVDLASRIARELSERILVKEHGDVVALASLAPCDAREL